MTLTPDLLGEFDAAMEDLEDLTNALDELGPNYLRACMAAGPRAGTPTRPPGMPVHIARAVREIADDALVRHAARTPAPPRRAAHLQLITNP
jgi:hypothetical protein